MALRELRAGRSVVSPLRVVVVWVVSQGIQLDECRTLCIFQSPLPEGREVREDTAHLGVLHLGCCHHVHKWLKNSSTEPVR